MAYLRSLKALERRIGQQGVADVLNVSPRTVRRWKQGIRKPSQQYQKQIQASYSYLKNTKPLSQVKNKSRAKANRYNKVSERIEAGYIVRDVKRYKKAQTTHKTVDVTHLSNEQMLDTIDTLHLREGYTSFGVKLLIESDEIIESDEEVGEQYEVISSEYLRYEDFKQEGTALIADMIESLKSKYKVKKLAGIFITAIKEI
jgi:transcriptional regulator with XRE-family HTH domain